MEELRQQEERSPSVPNVEATPSGKGATAGYPDGSVGVPPVKPEPPQQTSYDGVARAMDKSPFAINPVLYTEVERTLKEATIRVKEEATEKDELGDSDEEKEAAVQIEKPLSSERAEEIDEMEDAYNRYLRTGDKEDFDKVKSGILQSDVRLDVPAPKITAKRKQSSAAGSASNRTARSSTPPPVAKYVPNLSWMRGLWSKSVKKRR